MTNYQKISSERKRNKVDFILNLLNRPMFIAEIVELAGFSEFFVRNVIYEFPKNIRQFDMAKNKSGRSCNRYHVVNMNIDEPKPNGTIGVVHRLMDDPRYHENMKLRREERKRDKVCVSGQSLGGF